MYPEYLQKYIPPNFDILKYESSKTMDLDDWIANLMFRRIDTPRSDKDILDEVIREVEIYGYVKPDISDDQIIKNYRLNDKNQSEKMLKRLLEHGAFHRDRLVDERAIEYYKQNKDELLIFDDYSEIVRDISLKEVKWCVEAMDLMPDYDEFMDLYNFDQNESRDAQKKKLLNSFRPYGFDKGNTCAWLSVDFSCSDKEITQAFDLWLKQSRKKLDKPNVAPQKSRDRKVKQFGDTARRKWYATKILPYLDLVNWNLLHENNPTSAVLGEILFPSNPSSTDMINDTVKPLAKKLTSHAMNSRMTKVARYQSRKKITQLTS